MKRSSVVVMRKKNFGSHCLAVIPAGFLLFFVILFLGTRLFLRADARSGASGLQVLYRSPGRLPGHTLEHCRPLQCRI